MSCPSFSLVQNLVLFPPPKQVVFCLLYTLLVMEDSLLCKEPLIAEELILVLYQKSSFASSPPLLLGPSFATILSKLLLFFNKVFSMLVYLWYIFKEHTHVYVDYFFHQLKFQGTLCNFGLLYLKDKNKNLARPYRQTPKCKPCTFVWGLWIKDNSGVTNKVTLSATCSVNFFVTCMIYECRGVTDNTSRTVQAGNEHSMKEWDSL